MQKLYRRNKKVNVFQSNEIRLYKIIDILVTYTKKGKPLTFYALKDMSDGSYLDHVPHNKIIPSLLIKRYCDKKGNIIHQTKILKKHL